MFSRSATDPVAEAENRRIDWDAAHIALRSVGNDPSTADAEPVDGLLGTVVLKRGPMDLGPTGSSRQSEVLEYRQFDSELSRRNYLRRVGGTPEESTFDLRELMTLETDLDLRPDQPRLNLVTMMEPEPGQLDPLLRHNWKETGDYFRHRDGFLAVAFHVTPSPDSATGPAQPRRLFEYLQWASPEALAAATATDRFQAHLDQNSHYCAAMDVGVYEIVSSLRHRS